MDTAVLLVRKGRTYRPVMDVDGPMVTTCQGCGEFDYVEWIAPNGFEYCPDCCADETGE